MDPLTLPDQLDAAVRAAIFACELAATGLAWFMLIFGAALRFSLQRLRIMARSAAVASVLALIAHLLLQPARMAGEFSGLADMDLVKMSLLSKSGAAIVMQLAGVLLLIVALRGWHRGPSRFAAALMAIAAFSVAAGFALTGHTTLDPLRPLLAAALLLHLLAAQFWVGALLALPALARLETAADSSTVIKHFSQLGGWLVPLIPLAGVLLAALLLPSLTALRRPYGMLLLAKAALTGLAFAVAAANRWRLGPAMANGSDTSREAFRRAVIIETCIVALIIGCAAVLTTWFSPE